MGVHFAELFSFDGVLQSDRQAREAIFEDVVGDAVLRAFDGSFSESVPVTSRNGVSLPVWRRWESIEAGPAGQRVSGENDGEVLRGERGFEVGALVEDGGLDGNAGVAEFAKNGSGVVRGMREREERASGRKSRKARWRLSRFVTKNSSRVRPVLAHRERRVTPISERPDSARRTREGERQIGTRRKWSQFRNESGRESGGEDLVNFRSELKIEIADALNAMSVEIDDHLVPNVEPLGMVVHGFGDERDLGHPAKGGDEVLALKGLVQFAVDEGPASCGLEMKLNFGVGQFLRFHGSPPVAG